MNNKRLHFLLWVSFFPILLASTQGQTTCDTIAPVEQLKVFVKKAVTFNQLYPQEKVYLHFDNTGYFQEETIWFKAYVTQANTMLATSLSKVLYVELLDQEGHVLQTRKLCLKNGQGNGEIPLTQLGLRSGYYEVRAYTNYMLNWDNSAIFSRVFPVFERPQRLGGHNKRIIRERFPEQILPYQREEAIRLRRFNVEFYPEGGTLIDGLGGVVAFKAIDETGQGVEATGTLVNEKDEEIGSFKTLHEGMGYVVVPPAVSPTLLKVKLCCNGKMKAFKLPEAETEGACMQVNIRPENLLVRIQRSEKYHLPTNLGLAVSCNGVISTFRTLNLSAKTEQTLPIIKDDLSAGVNLVTLFTPEGLILAERLLFIPPKEQLLFKAKPQKKYYAPLDSASIDFRVSDTEGNPVSTTFSVAVHDAERDTPSLYKENVLTNMLLSSDLKGFIANPLYYFESTDSVHEQALNLLMLTQGWRRYSFRQLIGKDSFERRFKVERNIPLEGTVPEAIKRVGEKEYKPSEVTISMGNYQGKAPHETIYPVDTLGYFVVPLTQPYYDRKYMVFSAKKQGEQREEEIALHKLTYIKGRALQPFETDFNFYAAKSLPTETNPAENDTTERSPSTTELSLSREKKETMLQNVEVTARRLGKITLQDRDKFVVYPLREVLERTGDERINPYFYNFFTQEYPDFEQKTKYGERVYGWEKGIDLQGGWAIPLYQNVGIIYTYEVESVLTVKDRELCIRAFPQLASYKKDLFYTKIFQNELMNNRLHNFTGEHRCLVQFYSTPQLFNGPNYKDFKLPDEQDYRRTLYWNPNVQTDKQGKATIGFYNNSTCRKFSISAEGMSSDGTFGGINQ